MERGKMKINEVKKIEDDIFNKIYFKSDNIKKNDFTQIITVFTNTF